MTETQTQQFVLQVPGLLAELERRAKALFGIKLSPVPEALPQLERIADFLWRTRDSFDEQDQRINTLLLSAYLGEIMRRATDGAWRVDSELGLPVIDLPDGRHFQPVRPIQRRLSEGGPPLTQLPIDH